MTTVQLPLSPSASHAVAPKDVAPAVGRAPDGRQVRLATSELKRPVPADIAPSSATLVHRLQPTHLRASH